MDVAQPPVSLRHHAGLPKLLSHRQGFLVPGGGLVQVVVSQVEVTHEVVAAHHAGTVAHLVGQLDVAQVGGPGPVEAALPLPGLSELQVAVLGQNSVPGGNGDFHGFLEGSLCLL